MIDGEGPTLRARTAMDALFALDRRGIRYCILRNYDEIERDPGRDIDIVVDQRDLPQIRKVMSSLRTRHGWQAVCECRGHHEGHSFYFLSPGPPGEPVQQLEIHCTRIRWAGLPVLDEHELLERRVRAENGLWVASRRDQCLQIALQRGLAAPYSELKPEHRLVLQNCLGDDQAELHTAIASKTSAAAADAMCASIAQAPAAERDGADRWAFIRSTLRRRGPSRCLLDFASAVIRKAQRRTRPRCGVMVLGHDDTPPDLDRMRRLLSPMFLNVASLEPTARGVRGYAQACEQINHAGLLVVAQVPEHRWIVRALRSWSLQLTEQSSDQWTKNAVIDTFLAHHMAL